MNLHASPEAYSADLSRERLQVLAEIIAEVRREVAREGDRNDDGAWSVGCTSYERVHLHLEKAQRQYPWLRLEKSASLSWVIFVGREPLKLIREDSRNKQAGALERAAVHEVSAKAVAASFQPRLPMGRDSEEPSLLRLEVVATPSNNIAALYLKRYHEGDLRSPVEVWEIPIPAETIAASYPLPPPPPVAPPPADFKLPGSETKTDTAQK